METTLKNATFNLDAGSGHPTITRELEFKNGDRVSFTVTLDRDDKATLPDLHRASAERVIALLQAWIAPK